MSGANKNLIVINGSPHADGTTAKCLESFAEHLRKKYSLKKVTFMDLPINIFGCKDCGNGCVKYCRFRDTSFVSLINEIEESDYVLFGSPVYLDMPTGQMVNLLTRLNCMAENTNREWFKNKKAFFLATGYCSGTKCVIRTMQGACEMLGFTIEGRSSREYIKLWKDKKVRGGYKGEDVLLVN